MILTTLEECLEIAENYATGAYPVEYNEGDVPMPAQNGNKLWRSIKECKDELIDNDPLSFLEDTNMYWISGGFIMKCSKYSCPHCNGKAFISLLD